MEASRTSPNQSRAATIGYRLVTVALALASIFAVVFAISVVVGVARDGKSLLSGERLSVPVELSAASISPLPAGISLPSWLPVRVDISDPTTEQMLLSSALDVGPIVIVLTTLWLLRGLARSVTEGDPFGPVNVRCLRRLGYLFVLGVPAIEVVSTSLRRILWENLPPHPEVDLGVSGFEMPATALLAGLGAFVLAEVFARGVRLRDDVEGTV